MKSLLSKQSTTYQTLSGYGVDVSSVRVDDLDRKILSHLQVKPAAKVLDVGCGWGGQAVRMAKAGAEVVAVDVADLSDHFAEQRQIHNLAPQNLHFIKANMSDLGTVLEGKTFTDSYSNRTLHYVRYKTALVVLRQLKQFTTDRLYVSVSGLDSALGDHYQHRDRDVARRFCCLDSAAQETFQIFQPVCLYHQDEFFDLLTAAGWQTIELYQSAFGNLKAVCR